jgi:hypothetical protein
MSSWVNLQPTTTTDSELQLIQSNPIHSTAAPRHWHTGAGKDKARNIDRGGGGMMMLALLCPFFLSVVACANF